MIYNTKKTIITTLLSCLFIAVIFTACDDDFTEEDALNAQQTIDLSIYVVDFFNTTALQDVNVSIVQDGATISGTTNEQGVATFADVKIGGSIPVTVSRENYTTVQRLVDVNVFNYRQGQLTETMPMLSLTENTATLRGKLEIQTDLTDDDLEVVPEGTTVTAILDLNDISELDGINSVEISGTTDANGNYELIVPATNRGVDYELKYSTLTLDQTIAINGNEGDPDFPATLPSIETISTVFNPRGSSEDVPFVQPVYATTQAAPAGGETIVFEEIDVFDGEIDGITVENSGSGYATFTEFSVNITSLFGGSGADIRFETDGSGRFDLFTTFEGGSGYPSFNNANRRGQEDPSFDFSVSNVETGEILVIDGFYGSGTFRSREIQ